MLSVNRVLGPKTLCWKEDIKVLRRDILLYASSFPSGSERDQHRQIALSPRRLFRSQNGSTHAHWTADASDIFFPSSFANSRRAPELPKM